jgi:hypothetical protein
VKMNECECNRGREGLRCELEQGCLTVSKLSQLFDLTLN